MVKLGNTLFHYRNFLFPVFYFLLFIPSVNVVEHPLIPIIIGLLVTLSGQAIRFITIGLVYIIRGGKNRQIYAEGLVTEGIFSHCRNPLYVGNILIIVGLGIMSNSLFFIAVMIPLFLFFYQAIVRAEENFLRNKFGAAYDEYTSKVNRWIPDFTGLGTTLSSMEFKWKRVMIKEYTTTYIWTTGAVLLIMEKFYLHFGITSLLDKLPVFISALIVLLACYLFVRFMKKTKRWTDK
ncbi:MAG TPA: isoprenylcysteine carboxylmethyltransferase family protein [Bacteroidia bacterium]|nr:isoprenylcysteine carboxylmethyltransferase family protein [Bacteroidia bacterium]